MIDEAKIQKDMKALDLTREEVLQMYADDDAIDHNAKLFELTDEQKKVEKKMRQADRKPTAYKFQKRERKPNEEKRELISMLAEALSEMEGMKVSNPERQIDFTVGENEYSIQLICHRKKKE